MVIFLLLLFNKTAIRAFLFKSWAR